MEHVQSLSERIGALKVIARSLQEGTAHTRLLPEVDQVLALPDELATASVGEREAIARQVREYEQAFDRLGYTLLDQIMPTTGASPVFQVVQAADEFRARLKACVGRTVQTAQGPLRLEPHHVEALSRYSLSIGTPPVTAAMHSLVSRTLFGAELSGLFGHLETLSCDRRALAGLLDQLQALVGTSLHYATAAEERGFLADAAQFINFEGAAFLNRAVVTESRERVTHLIAHHVFDTVGPDQAAPVRVIEGGRPARRRPARQPSWTRSRAAATAPVSGRGIAAACWRRWVGRRAGAGVGELRAALVHVGEGSRTHWRCIGIHWGRRSRFAKPDIPEHLPRRSEACHWHRVAPAAKQALCCERRKCFPSRSRWGTQRGRSMPPCQTPVPISLTRLRWCRHSHEPKDLGRPVLRTPDGLHGATVMTTLPFL